MKAHCSTLGDYRSKYILKVQKRGRWSLNKPRVATQKIYEALGNKHSACEDLGNLYRERGSYCIPKSPHPQNHSLPKRAIGPGFLVWWWTTGKIRRHMGNSRVEGWSRPCCAEKLWLTTLISHKYWQAECSQMQDPNPTVRKAIYISSHLLVLQASVSLLSTISTYTMTMVPVGFMNTRLNQEWKIKRINVEMSKAARKPPTEQLVGPMTEIYMKHWANYIQSTEQVTW